MNIRRKKIYFERLAGSPDPVVMDIRRGVHFSDADPMGIMWHGRYPLLFEEASEALGSRCGLCYGEYREAGLYAPILSLHIDYFQPLYLAEEFTVRASLIWNEGARLNTEFQVLKQDGSIATSGYTIQLFTDHLTGQPCMVSPAMLERCRNRWKAGEFH
ncbi:MAG: acyl-CoA thioesterase [Desulfuromonadales bacterium]|nr:acyl-CoA thioesterase [Desulfuromonadales bacterium]